MQKIKSVESLRGLAVLLVVVFHTSETLLPYGFVGVDVFMTISGFVITKSLLSREKRGELFNPFVFLKRRVARLGPPMVFAALVTLPVLAVTQSPLGAFDNSLKTAASSFVGASNGVIQYLNGGYFGSDAKLNGYLHSWSLSVEIQFYLLFALAATLAFAAIPKNRQRNLVIVLVALTVSSLAALLASLTFDLPFEELGVFGYYSPIVRAWQFSAGALVALLPILVRPRRVVGIAGMLAIALSASISLNPILNFGVFSNIIVASVGSLALLSAGWGGKETFGPLNSFFATVGTASYSWYLLHWPLIVSATAVSDTDLSRVLAALVSLLLALFFTVKIEGKIEAKSEWVRYGGTLGKKSRIVGTIALALLSATLIPFATSGFGDENLRIAKVQVSERHLPARLNWLCATGPLTLDNYDACQINGESDGRPIYLVGDSQAGHISEAVRDVGLRLDREVIISTTTSCPFYSLPGETGRCANFHQETLNLLNKLEPGDVVIAFSSSNPLDSVALQSLNETLTALSRVGHQVSLTGPIPIAGHKRQFNPRDCSLQSVRIGECFFSFSKAEISEEALRQEAIFRDLAEAPEISFLSLINVFCDEENCPTRTQDVVIYRDPSHLSVSANNFLVEPLVRVMQSNTG